MEGTNKNYKNQEKRRKAEQKIKYKRREKTR
jgi:hypothetical protein